MQTFILEVTLSIASVSKLSPSSKKQLDEIVRAHLQIFSAVRKFIGLAQRGAAKSTLLPLIEVIMESSIAHFRVEENLLHELRHPSYAALTEAHGQIELELVRFQDAVTSGRDISTTEYLHVLDNLIIHDILEIPLFDKFGSLFWNKPCPATV